MFIEKIIRSIVNIVLLIATLVSLSTLAEMTYNMAFNAAKESKSGFLSISALNKQLLSQSPNK